MNLIERLKEAYERAKRELHARNQDLDTALRAIEEASDDANLDELRAARDAAKAAFDTAAEEASRCKTNLTEAEERQRLLDANPVSIDPVVDQTRHASARGQHRSELTYRPDTPQRSFFRDAYAAHFAHDSAAAERLASNNREQDEIVRDRFPGQFRDIGTGAFTGLVVPQYLVDLYAPLARAGSPLVNATRKLPLPPEGLTLNISRLTTGSATAAQATENTAVQETDMDDTLLTVNVRTYAGMQDVSRQLLERGTLGDGLIYADLVAAYFTTLDSAVINADGTGGTHLGIRSTSGIVAVTYTDATPTVAELYPKIADAIQQINAGRFEPATTIVMHPRRWGAFTAALDSSNRPLVVPNSNGPFNAIAVGEAAEYGQVVGVLHGLPVITDANIPTNLGAGTNEDVVLVERMPDQLLWWEGDGMPRQLRFEQVAPPQSIRLAVWGYSAFTAGRYPLASATISGTGLITPTF